MRVSLVSNWHERCGVAEYARNLEKELGKQFEVVREEKVYAAQGDVAVINWHPARLVLPPGDVRDLKARGLKTILIVHNSADSYMALENHPAHWADAVVAHQKMESNVEITYIPFGIPEVDELRSPGTETYIGIAGFPYAWKRFNLVADVAKRLGGKAVLIAPQHDMGDSTTPINDIQRIYPDASVLRHWMTQEEVVRTLSGCTLNIFWYQHMPPDDLQGQSGSVLMGVAAGRPMIVSKHPKLAHVAVYEDELYVVEKEEDVLPTAREIVEKLAAGEPVKMPGRIKKEMGWGTTGRIYGELIRKVAA